MNKNDILFTVSHVFSLHTLHTIICIILWGMKIYSMTCITSATHSGCPLHPSNFSRRFMFQYFMHLHCPSLETSWNCVGSLCYKAHAFSTDSTVQLGNACLVSDVLWHGLWCIIEWPQWVNWMWLFWDKPFVWHSSQTKPSKDLLYIIQEDSWWIHSVPIGTKAPVAKLKSKHSSNLWLQWPGPTIWRARTLDPQFGTAVPARSNAAPRRNFHITLFLCLEKEVDLMPEVFGLNISEHHASMGISFLKCEDKTW